MISVKVNIHDRFSIEFKVGFVVRRTRRYDDFAMNMWIFVPNSLDINPSTYDKQHFYGDIKSYVRLITPHFALQDVTRQPLDNLREALENAHTNHAQQRNAEYHLKMFGAIFKSALRERAAHVERGQEESYARDTGRVLSSFRALIAEPEAEITSDSNHNPALWVDEFMSNTAILRTFDIIKRLGSHPELTRLIEEEYARKEAMGYAAARADDPERNRGVVFRQGVLKKYVESDLFLVAQRKKDGRIVEQLLYSIAAGVSMIFATTVAFWGQRRFGSVATPFFFALVVSYMLKDRIKEVLRYYFAHNMSRRYFDTKTRISQKESEIGWMKESVDFVPDAKVPAPVMRLRNRSALLQAENHTLDEKILLYRKLLHLDRERLFAASHRSCFSTIFDSIFRPNRGATISKAGAKPSLLELCPASGNAYHTGGVNDIMRLHLTRFVAKADNPETPIPVFAAPAAGVRDTYLQGSAMSGSVTTVMGEHAYFVNIVLQMVAGGQTKYQRYRVAVTSQGIVGIEES